MGVRHAREAGTGLIRAEVCIVGAGVAGLVAATRIARSAPVRVIVLESGSERDDPTMRSVDRLENPAGNYEGSFRARGLGGTSVKWAGKLLPLSRHDALPRPYLDQTTWPFDLAELDRYTSEIETMMGVDREPYEEDASTLLDPEKLLPVGDGDFAQRWAKLPAPANRDLAHVLRQELAARENLEIWLGATASRFEFEGARLRTLEARVAGGGSLVIEADEFLITAGTFETTRLLLVADRQSNGLISGGADVLGRYFNDHLALEVATLRPIDPGLTNRTFATRGPLGTDRHLHFELRPSVQAEHRIGSAYFDLGFEVPEGSGLTQAKLALQAARRRELRPIWRHLSSTLADMPSLLHTAEWRFRRRQKYWPPYGVARVKVWIEQLPRRCNRLFLSDRLDALGQPMLRVDFQKTEDDERSFRVCAERLRAFWDQRLASVCQLDWDHGETAENPGFADASIEMAHPAGSTRMGEDPTTSVVDPSLRVHRVPNLSVASASVFPSSGSANPTLTIMQLAMRATECIIGRVARDREPYDVKGRSG